MPNKQADTKLILDSLANAKKKAHLQLTTGSLFDVEQLTDQLFSLKEKKLDVKVILPQEDDPCGSFVHPDPPDAVKRIKNLTKLLKEKDIDFVAARGPFFQQLFLIDDEIIKIDHLFGLRTKDSPMEIINRENTTLKTLYVSAFLALWKKCRE